MSEQRRRPVINAERVIINAEEVIIIEANDKRRHRREDVAGIEDRRKNYDDDNVLGVEDNRKRRFPW
ncbi:hypothetical protein FS935_02355 [Metabacillus litoralis]|uniref:Uncharacterized protein n=1 Tax=Metabacillus litoralis TaxID=152268 RepID=A0A5C6W512_9BACI|nr:hypothetical protein [Metabacillus litoralis]TXC93057.1 hypothetical protein FS935_02355 [Metabacillus litoralis]